MKNFIGRQRELKRLNEVGQKGRASFVLLKGRRRVGKSTLIEEFGKSFEKVYTFIGFPPNERTTHQEQLNEFSRQLARNFNIPYAQYNDWSDILWVMAERVQQGKILLFFDEIAWMASKDKNFLGKLKTIWDQYLKKNDNLFFVVCGSASSWIDKNILSSSGFVGRISLSMTLEELPLNECSKFWNNDYISPYEKLKVLAVTGGVPRYLEEINPKITAEQNIMDLCFTSGGMLVEEFEQIFSDVFLRRSDFYKKIVRELANGSKEQVELIELLAIDYQGRISEYLEELEIAGFVARDFTWHLKTGVSSKLSRYRLKDNYLRFYVKYIEKNLDKIKRNSLAIKSINFLPGWANIMGLQFENLVLNNRNFIYKELGITPDEIINDNPYFQRTTKNSDGCQVDYMIQTKFSTLYICEVKFYKDKIGSSVIEEFDHKIKSLSKLRGFSIRPVLIHVNGVTADLEESDYFAKIIDFSKVLVGSS